MYGLLTKCDVEFFFLEFMDRDVVEVDKLEKKKTRPISSHLDRTGFVNKGFIIWLSGKFLLPGTPPGGPRGQDSSVLPARVANYSAGFDSSFPLFGASQITVKQ